MEEALGSKNQTATYQPEGSPNNQSHQVPRLLGHFDFVNTLGMEMTAGRGYSKAFAADTLNSIIINEAAAKFFGWTAEEAIGKRIDQGIGQQQILSRQIVEVIKDFNYASLHNSINPFILELPQNTFQMNIFMRYIAVKVKSDDFQNTLAFMENKFKDVVPNRSFEYFFLDDNLNKLYEAEVKMSKVFTAFSFLAIFIACLGLFALASFTAEQRTKEVGIRKVMGASVMGLVGLISKEFVLLVIAANIVAWLIANFVMDYWLDTFAYRIYFGWGTFFLSGLIALVIAMLTVSYQAFKAANANPVDSIRND